MVSRGAALDVNGTLARVTRRRLEQGARFWEITVQGATLSIVTGTSGQPRPSKTRTFTSPQAASDAAERLVWEHLAQGYEEVGGVPRPVPGPRPAPAPRAPTRTTVTSKNGTMEILFSHQTVLTNLLVQEFDTPEAAEEFRDRCIRLQRGGERTVETVPITEEEAARAVEVARAAQAATAAAQGHTVRVDLKKRRWIGTLLDDEVATLQDCTRLIDRIERDAPSLVQIVCDPAIPDHRWAKAITKRRLVSVRSFVFDTPFQTQTRQRRNSLGDLRATLTAFPSLERLFATGTLELSKGSHQTLRELHLLGDPIETSLLEGLGASSWASLERLVISLASDAGPVEGEALCAALARMQAPRLGEVVVSSVADVVSFLGHVLDLAPRWRRLSVQGSVRNEDELLALLEARAGELAGLEELGVPLEDEVSIEDTRRVLRSAPCVKSAAEWAHLTLPAAYKTWG